MKRLQHKWIVLGLITLLTACAGLQKDGLNTRDPLYLKRTGKSALLVKETKTNKMIKSAQIRIEWMQVTPKTTMNILSPFGTSYGQMVVKDGQEIELTTPLGKQKGQNAEQLLKRHTGFVMPVSGMRYWVKGLLVPNVPVEKAVKNEAGQYTAIQQQGWDMTLSKYDQYGPKQIKMKRMMKSGQTLQLRLIFE
ncbi:MAG: outer membrane lipoprotein LolB [Alcaligenaceae bacterium]|nr:outer membrane lipoprotein LolB [Alcaligenaceae bacterium]